MKQKADQDGIQPEYDFSSGIRGKHHKAYRQGTNLVLLEPDVAEVFQNDPISMFRRGEAMPRPRRVDRDTA